MRQVLHLGAGIIAAVLVMVCAGVSAAESAEDRIVFHAMLNEETGWQVYLSDSDGVRQITHEDDLRELRPINRSLVGVELLANGMRHIARLNVDTGSFKIMARTGSATTLFLPSPNDQGFLRVELNGQGGMQTVVRVGKTGAHETVKLLYKSARPAQWTCSGEAVFLVETGSGKIMKLDLDSKKLTDITPEDLELFTTPRWVSISCDERVMAIAPDQGARDYSIFVYRDGKRITTIEGDSVIEPYVTRDGTRVLYTAHFGKPLNRIMSYNIVTGETVELVGPIGAMATPFLLEGE